MQDKYQYFVFTPHPSDAEMKTTPYTIDYICNGDRWTALYSLQEKKFYHYPNGVKAKGHTDDYLIYTDECGKSMCMKIINGKIHVGLNKSVSQIDPMICKCWNGKLWTIDLVRPINMHPDLC